MKFYSAKEVAEIAGVDKTLVCKWAKKNNIKTMGAQNSYVFFEKDLENFASRNRKVGQPKKNKE